MTPWRIGRTWSETDRTRHLAHATTRPLSVPDEAELTFANGWNQVGSSSIVGREQPGNVAPRGLFQRARDALESYSFSDPRIVRAHFDDATPLMGRTLLLELRASALHLLCPVRVGAVRDASEGTTHAFGFRIDTVEGHVERGSEWFFLTKDLEDGTVRFRIEAFWRPGEFPNPLFRLGFHLVAQRYQRAWHRLAHLRMREFARHPASETRSEDRLLHEKPALEGTPIRMFTRRGGPGGAVVEEEHELKA